MQSKESPRAKQLLEAFADTPSSKSVAAAFQGMWRYLRNFESKLTQDFQQLSQTLESKVDHVYVGHRVAQMEHEHRQRMSAIDTRVASIKDGDKGDKGETGDKGDPGDPGAPGRDGSPDNPIQLVTKLRSLKPGQRLSLADIDGIDEAFKDFNRRVTHLAAGVVGRDIIKDYDLSPFLNGVTQVFNIPANWNIIAVHLSSAPNILRKNIDYTYTTTSISFDPTQIPAAAQLAAGQTCVITYVAG